MPRAIHWALEKAIASAAFWVFDFVRDDVPGVADEAGHHDQAEDREHRHDRNLAAAASARAAGSRSTWPRVYLFERSIANSNRLAVILRAFVGHRRCLR